MLVTLEVDCSKSLTLARKYKLSRVQDSLLADLSQTRNMFAAWPRIPSWVNWIEYANELYRALVAVFLGVVDVGEPAGLFLIEFNF